MVAKSSRQKAERKLVGGLGKLMGTEQSSSRPTDIPFILLPASHGPSPTSYILSMRFPSPELKKEEGK